MTDKFMQLMLASGVQMQIFCSVGNCGKAAEGVLIAEHEGKDIELPVCGEHGKKYGLDKIAAP